MRAREAILRTRGARPGSSCAMKDTESQPESQRTRARLCGPEGQGQDALPGPRIAFPRVLFRARGKGGRRCTRGDVGEGPGGGGAVDGLWTRPSTRPLSAVGTIPPTHPPTHPEEPADGGAVDGLETRPLTRPSSAAGGCGGLCLHRLPPQLLNLSQSLFIDACTGFRRNC